MSNYTVMTADDVDVVVKWEIANIVDDGIFLGENEVIVLSSDGNTTRAFRKVAHIPNVIGFYLSGNEGSE